jgi:hypothetical protein
MAAPAFHGEQRGGVDRDDAPSGGGPLPHVYGRGWHGGIGDGVRARGKGWKAGRGGENDGAKDVGGGWGREHRWHLGGDDGSGGTVDALLGSL